MSEVTRPIEAIQQNQKLPHAVKSLAYSEMAEHSNSSLKARILPSATRMTLAVRIAIHKTSIRYS